MRLVRILRANMKEQNLNTQLLLCILLYWISFLKCTLVWRWELLCWFDFIIIPHRSSKGTQGWYVFCMRECIIEFSILTCYDALFHVLYPSLRRLRFKFRNIMPSWFRKHSSSSFSSTIVVRQARLVRCLHVNMKECILNTYLLWYISLYFVSFLMYTFD